MRHQLTFFVRVPRPDVDGVISSVIEVDLYDVVPVHVNRRAAEVEVVFGDGGSGVVDFATRQRQRPITRTMLLTRLNSR